MKFHLFRAAVLCVAAATGVFGQTQQAPEKPQQQETEKGPDAPPTPPKSIADGKTLAPIAGVDPKTFQIGAEDILAVQVWRENDISRQVIVRPDGKITMPLIGEVQASEVTPDDLAKNLTEAYSKYLNNPQITVSVLAVNSKKFFITGEVNRAGSYPLAVPTRVLEALSGAGGFRDFANTKKIIILRKGERIKFNYKDVIKGKNMDQNILLENGDYIIVP